MTKKQTQKIDFAANFQKFGKGLSNFINTLILFVGIIGSFAALTGGFMTLYSIFLDETAVPDISGPVARYVADVDFDNRKISFDTTFSKTQDSAPQISIWRFGDGKVIKSATPVNIAEYEVTEYTYAKPGTYVIGYSIIDGNNLSDEATCIVTFADDTKGSETKDRVSGDCGKSATSYNSFSSIYNINAVRENMRRAYLMFGVAVVTLLGSILFNRLFKAFFIKE